MPSDPTTDVPVANPHRPRVVFLIGAPRSDTTWLQSLLGSHREIVTPQETDLFATFIAPLQTWWDDQVGRSDSEQRERRMKGLQAIIDDTEFTALLAGFIDHVLDRYRSIASPVPSVEPSSTTITSTLG